LGLATAISNVRPLLQKVTTLRGSDFLSTLTVKASPATAADRILATFPITPSGYVGTRITQLSQLWERYRLKSFNVRYVPAIPNTLATQLVGYIDTDPNDDPTIITDSDALVRQATAQAGSQQWNFIHSKVIPLAIRADDQWYYTGNDKSNERFNRQGTGFIVQVTDPVNFNGEPLGSNLTAGSLYIDWEVEFQIAQIEPAAVVAADDEVLNDVSTMAGQTFIDSANPLALTIDRSVALSLGFLDDTTTTNTISVDSITVGGAIGPAVNSSFSNVIFKPAGAYIVTSTSATVVNIDLNMVTHGTPVFTFL
jgi:hypothetical protein